MSHVDKKQQGFTLIEIVLSMTFISFLLIAIVLTIIQISTIYNHGITVKEVNQTGQLLSTELEDDIAATGPFSISGTPNNYIVQKSGTQITGGRLCTGQFSYIWNTGSALLNPTSVPNVYTSSASAPSTPIHFVKVKDSDQSYCVATKGAYKAIDPDVSTELLQPGDHDLVIQSFTVNSQTSGSDPGAYDSSTNQRLYDIKFSFGTNEVNTVAANTDGTYYCVASSSTADLSYCAVDVFEITALAGNSAATTVGD